MNGGDGEAVANEENGDAEPDELDDSFTRASPNLTFLEACSSSDELDDASKDCEPPSCWLIIHCARSLQHANHPRTHSLTPLDLHRDPMPGIPGYRV